MNNDFYASKTPNRPSTGMGLPAIWILVYLGVQMFQSMFYLTLSALTRNTEFGANLMGMELRTFYRVVNLGFSGIDLLLYLLMMITVKNTAFRIIMGVIMLVRVIEIIAAQYIYYGE